MKHTINNIQFKTDKELQEYAKKILYDGDINSTLNGEEMKFMTEYFESIHHEWIDKKGVGLSKIRRIIDKAMGSTGHFK